VVAVSFRRPQLAGSFSSILYCHFFLRSDVLSFIQSKPCQDFFLRPVRRLEARSGFVLGPFCFSFFLFFCFFFLGVWRPFVGFFCSRSPHAGNFFTPFPPLHMEAANSPPESFLEPALAQPPRIESVFPPPPLISPPGTILVCVSKYDPARLPFKSSIFSASQGDPRLLQPHRPCLAAHFLLGSWPAPELLRPLHGLPFLRS